jgi:hypothetical protein
MKCVLITVCDVCCTSEYPLPLGDGVWSTCITMKTGRYVAWLSAVAGHVGHQACALWMVCGVQTHSTANVTKELDIHRVLHRIVWDQLDYREVCAHRMSKNPTYDGMSHYGPCTCFADKREQFWS